MTQIVLLTLFVVNWKNLFVFTHFVGSSALYIFEYI